MGQDGKNVINKLLWRDFGWIEFVTKGKSAKLNHRPQNDVCFGFVGIFIGYYFTEILWNTLMILNESFKQ